MQRFLLRLAVAALATLSSTWAMANDQEVAQRIARALRESGRLVNYGIGVKYHDGTVWLMGRVASQQQMAVAIALAEKVPGVKQVVNNLTIDARPAAKATPAARQTFAEGEPTPAASELQQPQTGILGRVRKPTAATPVVRSVPLAPAPFVDLDAQPRANADPQVQPTAFPEESEPALEAAAEELRNEAAMEEAEELNGPELAQAAEPEATGPALRHASTGRSLVRRRVYDRSYEPAPLPAAAEEQNAATPAPAVARPARAPQWLAQAEQAYQAPRAGRSRQTAGTAQMPAASVAQSRRGTPRPIGPSSGARQPQHVPLQKIPPQVRVARLPQQGGYAAEAVGPSEYDEGGMGQPMPMYSHASHTGAAPMTYDQPHLPNYAWPSYAAYPNYAGVTYPRQYSPTCWPYIGPFYPYPQVPLGWRKVTLEWDDGWWFLDFDHHR
ncbi:MAG: BON domain-containing protein [Pirellulales bacterium]|nr:BON domain-containing protein [Pirellulales bacterium]